MILRKRDYLDSPGKVPAMMWGRGKIATMTAMKAEVVTQYNWLNSFRSGWFWNTRPWTQGQDDEVDALVLMEQYPVRIEDEDGAEEGDDEGGWSVNHPDHCPCLQFPHFRPTIEVQT